MRHVVVTFCLALAACGGLAEEDFASTYTLDWCEHRLACDDPAQLTFEGIVTADDCAERLSEQVGSWGDGCMYDGKQAEVCLADLEALTCPADGGLGSPPVSCDTVYVSCPAESASDTDG